MAYGKWFPKKVPQTTGSLETARKEVITDETSGCNLILRARSERKRVQSSTLSESGGQLPGTKPKAAEQEFIHRMSEEVDAVIPHTIR